MRRTASAHGLSTPRADDWRNSAACRADGTDPDVMFPGDNAIRIADAKRVCAKCPVWQECLSDALRTGDNEWGVRGGLLPRERRRLTDKPTAVAPPKAKQQRVPRATTLAEALARRSEPVGNGHVRCTGVRHVQHHGKRYTVLQAAFVLAHGRDPQGIVRPVCGLTECIRGDHLADEVIRDSNARCGTRPGYQRHRKHGEDACPPCRQANTDADNRLRRTGSTKAAA
ncbi:WhiB family transcriptional regulator [Streptomyces caniscabiei]|uniref:WhiB family transcriptional regulator n=1 Tax=Streptomyces caniscabiei TaxID=2746961 RepID=UPI0023512443|nr:WhiB family transcriptional regulator [Streptomyces caniscabiei]MDX3516217.1 WhiB family transcriptional regulator [Streptomyces caniscabiei]MDX3725277.1 WhiB family transcriptional regulator [Streptomyces caniscabiei]WEO27065.1 WhiB family transcriptional regulator [Streptomyces caniscabiei]